MIRSMTGFGRGEAESPRWHVQIDVRTVNHRFLDLRFRLPFYAPELELRLKEKISTELSRGKADVAIEVHERETATGESALRVHKGVIRDYLVTLKKIKEELAIPGEITLDHLAVLPWGKAFEISELRVDEEDLPLYDAALARALAALQKMRESEGRALQRDLAARLGALGKIVDGIEEGSRDLLPYFRDKLRERVRALLADQPVDESRLLQEAAFYAERADVSEEITRLRSHLRRLGQALDGDEAVGKRLDFLLQEVHREINTIGSKSKGAALTDLVIEAKGVAEAMREQVQNIE